MKQPQYFIRLTVSGRPITTARVDRRQAMDTLKLLNTTAALYSIDEIGLYTYHKYTLSGIEVTITEYEGE